MTSSTLTLGATWSQVRPGMQLLVNGMVWLVTSRQGDEIAMFCSATKRSQTGTPQPNKQVVILLPGHPQYREDGPPADREQAIQNVRETLGGRVRCPECKHEW